MSDENFTDVQERDDPRWRDPEWVAEWREANGFDSMDVAFISSPKHVGHYSWPDGAEIQVHLLQAQPVAPVLVRVLSRREVAR